MITTEKKSNKIQYKLKFVKYRKLEIFGSNHNVFCDFLMDLYYINSVGKVHRSLAISGKKIWVIAQLFIANQWWIWVLLQSTYY